MFSNGSEFGFERDIQVRCEYSMESRWVPTHFFTENHAFG